MLSKKARIGQAVFQKILKNKAFFVQTPLFALKITPIKEKWVKIACVVSKKEEKTAVLRNKIRRRAYGAVEKYMDRIKPGHALVFSLKKQIGTASATSIQEEIQLALTKAQILI